MTRLEICIDNLESLFTAQQAGADRIELCSALGLGGLTPSYGFMQQVARHATIPVYAMIRPRAGDFCFSAAEFELMLLDIAAARSAGLQGVVVGLLDEDGRVPEGKLRQLVEAAGPLGEGRWGRWRRGHALDGTESGTSGSTAGWGRSQPAVGVRARR